MKPVVLYLLFIFQFSFSQEKLTIYFDFDEYALNETAVKKINSWIAEGKEYQVTKLYGFCDWKGTNKYNDTLALQRVNTVYQFLIDSKVVVKKDIEIRGFGEDFEQSKIQRSAVTTQNICLTGTKRQKSERIHQYYGQCV